MHRKLKNITPGEILLEEFLNPLAISRIKLARDISVPVSRINEIIQGKRAITPDTALQLSVYFNMTPEFWMNLQSHYDLNACQREVAPEDRKEL